MKELKCQNCNSRDMEFKGGVWVCQNCGSKYIPDKDEIPDEDEESRLAKELVKAYNKQSELEFPDDILSIDDSDEKWEKQDRKMKKYEEKYDKYEEKINTCIEKLLKINEFNPYALTIKALKRIENGLKIREHVELVVDCAEKVISHATEEEKEETLEALRDNIRFNKAKMIEVCPEIKSRIENL